MALKEKRHAVNEMHEANRRGWDAASPQWQANIDADGAWRQCHVEPGLALDEEELEFLNDVADKEVCVLGSGDNLVVFALAGMGTRVTSVDISQKQLDIAAGRAGELELDIAFVRADVTDLSALGNESFDLVYTGGHVAVWVSDLRQYYAEAVRILKSGGRLVVDEYHPFRRIWKDRPERLEVDRGYFDRGPYRYDRSSEAPGAEAGSLPSFEFHWTVADFATAILDAGCQLIALREWDDRSYGWENAPLRGLPGCLLMVAEKRNI